MVSLHAELSMRATTDNGSNQPSSVPSPRTSRACESFDISLHPTAPSVEMRPFHQVDNEGQLVRSYFLTRFTDDPSKVGILATNLEMSSTGPSSEERSAVAHASPNGSQTVQVTHRSIEPSFGRTTMHRYVDLEQDISDDIDNCEYSDTVLGFPSGPDEKFKVVGASFLPDTAAGKSHFLECPGDLPSELKDTLRQWERDAIHSICQGSNSAGGSPTSEIKKGRNGLLLTEGMILDLKQATWVGSQPGEKKTQGGMVFYQYSAGTDADYPKEWTREVASRLYPADCNVEDAVQSFVEGSQK